MLKSVEGTSFNPPVVALPVTRAESRQPLMGARPSSCLMLLPILVYCVCHRKSQAAGETEAPEVGTRLFSLTRCCAFSSLQGLGTCRGRGGGRVLISFSENAPWGNRGWTGADEEERGGQSGAGK